MSATTTPPRRHGRQALDLGKFGKSDELWLPRCDACGRIAYPLRELCGDCLSDRLEWRRVEPTGTVLAVATLHRSNDPFFRAQLPLRIASIRLEEGPVVIAFLSDEGADAGAKVSIRTCLDEGGGGVLVAASSASKR